MSSIKKIVLEVGGVDLSLSPEDAKTLQSALNELFPIPAKQEIRFYPAPQPIQIRPWYWYEYGGSAIQLYSAGNSGTTGAKLNLSNSSFTAPLTLKGGNHGISA